MPSLNLDLDYFTNPKIIRLVGLLGVGDAGFTIPIRLWTYVAKHHAATGKLAGYTRPEIEAIVGWHGEAGRCIEALLALKLLEIPRGRSPKNISVPEGALLKNNSIICMAQSGTKTGRSGPEIYIVHDWLEHAGHLSAYKKRAKLAASVKWANYRNASSTASSIAPASSTASSSHLISSQFKENNPDSEGSDVSSFSAMKKDVAEQEQRMNQRRRELTQELIAKFPRSARTGPPNTHKDAGQ